MTLSARKVSAFLFWTGLLFSTLYLSYRYPLQINFSGTSPTYSDTPLSLKLGKFFVMSVICLAALPFFLRKKFTWQQIFVIFTVLFVSIIPAIKALGAFDGVYFDISFWPLAALLLVGALDQIRSQQIDKYLQFLFGYSILSTLVQVALFIFYGRLPALAYDNSISVRFGGFLDDPNGFAAVLFLLIGWAYYRYSGFKRLLAESLLLVCLLLTQSFTAVGFLFLLLVILFARLLYKRPARILWILPCLAVILPLLASLYVSTLSDTISLLFQLKLPSINQHAFPWGVWMDEWTKWIVMGDSPFNFYESWWASSLINFGILWYMADLFLVGSLVYSVIRAFRTITGQINRAVLSGTLIFCAYFVFGSVNLPLFTVFPINFLFFVLTFLVAFKRIDWEIA